MPRGPFHECGFDFLVEFCELAFSSLQPEDIKSLLIHDAKRIRIGTMCSGTDSPIAVVQAFCKASKLRGECSSTIDHASSAEACPKKQSYLLSVFGKSMRVLFPDVCKLSEGVAFDHANKQQVVEGVHELWIGWPCQDVSRSCPNRTQSRSVVLDGSKRTGRVFHGLCDYVARHADTLDIVFGENVLGLQDKSHAEEFSNLDWCVAMLEQKCNCWVCCFELDPYLSFGFPAQRPRLWFIIIPWARLVGCSKADLDQKAHQLIAGIAEASGKVPSVGFDECLLPEDHQIVRSFYRDSAQKFHRQLDAPKKRARDADWPLLHEQLFRKAGKDWTAAALPGDDIKAMYPGLLAVPLREYDVLSFHGFLSLPLGQSSSI